MGTLPDLFYGGGHQVDVKELVKLAGVTRGRISPRTVFQDFAAFAALLISNGFDPVHYTERTETMGALLKGYTQQEQTQLMSGLREFALQCQKNLWRGWYEDILGLAYFELGLGGHDGQDFSPHCVGELAARIVLGARPNFDRLPEEGYFTVMDPACGSGVLALATAEQMAAEGLNPCQHMVIQANDVSLCCVHMAYVQLSCYGIPAVIIHGNTLNLKEYSRWYTPAYILEDWVWHSPMPFAPGRNLSDEWLKMSQDPMYLAIRRMTWPELFTTAKKE